MVCVWGLKGREKGKDKQKREMQLFVKQNLKQ